MAGDWSRIERYDALGRLLDWVEVGRCVSCGQGVDRAFPVEYRVIQGAVHCRRCAPAVAVRLEAPGCLEAPGYAGGASSTS